jgi:hypothetical protein
MCCGVCAGRRGAAVGGEGGGGGGGESDAALGGGAVLCFGRRLVAIARSSAKSGELRVERTAAGCQACTLTRSELTKACELLERNC